MKIGWISFFFTFTMMVFLASCAEVHKSNSKTVSQPQEKNPGENGADIAYLEKTEGAKRHAEENIRHLKSSLQANHTGGLAIYEVYASSMAKNLTTLCNEHANNGHAEAVAWCCERHYLTTAFCGKP